VNIIQSHNGEYIARSNKILPFSGSKPERSVVIGLDSMQEARKRFFSEEYEKIKQSRENSTKSRVFLSKMREKEKIHIIRIMQIQPTQ
jgi:uncharacterized protein (DUF1330 family)